MIWLSYRDIEEFRGFQRVPEVADRTEGMSRTSWINQFGPQKLNFQVSKRSELILQRYRDIEGSRRAPEGSRGADGPERMTRISGINQLGPQKLKLKVS